MVALWEVTDINEHSQRKREYLHLTLYVLEEIWVFQESYISKASSTGIANQAPSAGKKQVIKDSTTWWLTFGQSSEAKIGVAGSMPPVSNPLEYAGDLSTEIC